MKIEEAIRIMDLFVKNIAVENVKVFELKDACKVALLEIEHLQKENEELKEENKALNEEVINSSGAYKEMLKEQQRYYEERME